MPNHVTNRITGPAAILDRLTRAATDDDLFGHTTTPGGRVIDFNCLIPEIEDNFDRYDWYDWRRNHWGTKWNAYTPSITTHDDGTVTVEFRTAWSAPSGIISELTLRLPGETLHVQWADDDLGSNVGDTTIRDSVIIRDDTPIEGTDEARDYAARLCYGKTYAEHEAENL